MLGGATQVLCVFGNQWSRSIQSHPDCSYTCWRVGSRILRATTPRMIVTSIGNQPGFSAPLYDQKRKKGKYTEQQPAQCHSVYVTPWLWLALVLVLEAVI